VPNNIFTCQKCNISKQKVYSRVRGHSELNQGPIDLQSIALPLAIDD
jgi:hypothetical protein